MPDDGGLLKFSDWNQTAESVFFFRVCLRARNSSQHAYIALYLSLFLSFYLTKFNCFPLISNCCFSFFNLAEQCSVNTHTYHLLCQRKVDTATRSNWVSWISWIHLQITNRISRFLSQKSRSTGKEGYCAKSVGSICFMAGHRRWSGRIGNDWTENFFRVFLANDKQLQCLRARQQPHKSLGI